MLFLRDRNFIRLYSHYNTVGWLIKDTDFIFLEMFAVLIFSKFILE